MTSRRSQAGFSLRPVFRTASTRADRRAVPLIAVTQLRKSGAIVAAFVALALWAPGASAQDRDTTGTVQQADTVAADTVAAPADGSRPMPLFADSLRADSVQAQPATPADSRLKEPIRFTAADSLVLLFDEEGDTGTLYGQAKVEYDEATLTAHRVDILFEIDELRAAGMRVDTGVVGPPEFVQGGESFRGDALAYNLRTERGRAVAARTQMQEGFIRGEVVKVLEDSTALVSKGLYTTCACIEDPSYSLRADRMKVVDQEWVYTGPIRLYLFNIPTPLWLPFGFLPAIDGRRSGPLPPTYGEDERGFYLRDMGWYWAINDYMDAQVQFGTWTRGSWQVAPRFRYARRYRYSGDLSLDYIQNRSGERGDPDRVLANTSALRWTHNQTLSPTARFSANVNLATSGYLRTASDSYDDRVRQQVESAIRYSKQWTRTQRSLNLSLSQREVLQTGEASFQLPSLSFSQGQRTPFAREDRIGEERWYERIAYSYNGTLTNRVDYRPLRNDTSEAVREAAQAGWWTALRDPGRFRLATGGREPFDFTARHSVPVSASFSMNRIPIIRKALRLNFNTSVNYTEDWYGRTYRLAYDDSLKRAVTRQQPGFFAYRQFTSSAAANTTIYGIFPFRIGPLDGFRHTLRPSLGLAFAPDFGSGFWGYTRSYETTPGNFVRYNIATGQTLGPYSGGQSSLTFSLDNVFETRLAARDTSAGEARRTPLKLLDVDLSGAYNFAADSLNLSDITLSARSDLFNRLNLSLRSTLSPYAADTMGRPINRFVFSPSAFRIARFLRLDFTARTTFRSGSAGSGRPVTSTRMRTTGLRGMDGIAGPGTNPPLDDGSLSPNAVGSTADFELPWSLGLDLSYSLNGNTLGQFVTDRHVANLNARFDFNLTPNWKVEGQTGFDLVRRDIVTTTFNVYRDFECWQMSFSWTPLGRYASYSFDLHVKSGKLADLLRIRQPRSDVRGRFGGL